MGWFLVLYFHNAFGSEGYIDSIYTSEPQIYPFVTETYIPIIPKSKFNAWSCVIFARQYTGRDDIKGTAGNLKPTVARPYVGGIVLLDEGRYGHIAVITDIASQSLSLIEANYKPGKITTRTIPQDFPLIVGYK